jgi:hypothetical protein
MRVQTICPLMDMGFERVSKSDGRGTKAPRKDDRGGERKQIWSKMTKKSQNFTILWDG